VETFHIPVNHGLSNKIEVQLFQNVFFFNIYLIIKNITKSIKSKRTKIMELLLGIKLMAFRVALP